MFLSSDNSRRIVVFSYLLVLQRKGLSLHRGHLCRVRMELSVASVDEIAATENLNASYVSGVLRLTLLAPAIVEAILDRRQPAEMTLTALTRPFVEGEIPLLLSS